MALLLFFRMMMEADFQLVGKWLKEKQAEKRTTKWNFIRSYEWFNQTEEMSDISIGGGERHVTISLDRV